MAHVQPEATAERCPLLLMWQQVAVDDGHLDGWCPLLICAKAFLDTEVQTGEGSLPITSAPTVGPHLPSPPLPLGSLQTALPCRARAHFVPLLPSVRYNLVWQLGFRVTLIPASGLGVSFWSLSFFP